jgi:hypothetical protein
MRRLVLGFGLGGLLAYGWRRFFGTDVEPVAGRPAAGDASASLEDELMDRARPDRPAGEEHPEPGETEPAVEPKRST